MYIISQRHLICRLSTLLESRAMFIFARFWLAISFYLNRLSDTCPPEQIPRLWEVVLRAHWRTFFLVAVTGRLRYGEMVSMQWQNLAWHRETYLGEESYDYSGKKENHIFSGKQQRPQGFA